MYLADNKRKIIGGVILAVVLGSITFSTTLFLLPGKDYTIIRIVDKVGSGATMETYAHRIADSIEEVFDLQDYWKVKVEVTVLEPISFQQVVFEEKDFDIAIVELNYTSTDPDVSFLFSENGTMNIFGTKLEMPFGEEMETLLENSAKSTNISEYTHYGDFGMTYRQVMLEFFQYLLMDKIATFLPLFCSKIYETTWSNLNGYDSNWGIADSLPYMFFDGLHTGQTSISELRVFEETWKNLNPVYQEINSEDIVTNLISGTLVKFSPEGEPLKTGLIEDWTQINESHFQFQLRDNVYWNPSYDVKDRTESSSTLDPLSSDLMFGLKDETSNGTNQQVTAKDAVFTLLAKGNSIVSDYSADFNWVKDIWIDPIDNLSFHIVIDGDITTPEIETWAPFWSYLETFCLPEFFLNSTSVEESLSSAGVSMKGIYDSIAESTIWQNYDLSPFGCGKYMIDHYIVNDLVVLQASPYWFEIGAKEGTHQELDISSISVLIIDNPTNALDEFGIGNIDIIDVTILTEERRQMENNAAYIVHDNKLSTTFSFIAFNLLSPLFGGDNNLLWSQIPGREAYTVGVALRKAIFYAINRIELNEMFHGGEHYIYERPIHPSLGYWQSQDIWNSLSHTGFPAYPYNMTLAEFWMSTAVESKLFYDSQNPTA